MGIYSDIMAAGKLIIATFVLAAAVSFAFPAGSVYDLGEDPISTETAPDLESRVADLEGRVDSLEAMAASAAASLNLTNMTNATNATEIDAEIAPAQDGEDSEGGEDSRLSTLP